MGITLKNNKSVTKNMTIKGDNGVGIKTITSGTPVVTEEKTTTPITVTLTDETTQNFNVEAKNGSGADNALTKPTTAPSTTQLVAVDNTNTQKMLTIGDGLSIENDTLKASASGEKLYLHILIFSQPGNPSLDAETQILTKNSTLFTSQSFYNYLTDNEIKFPIAGGNGTSDTIFSILNKVRSQGSINAYSFAGIGVSLDNGKFSYSESSLGVAVNTINLVDTVIEL